MYNMFACVNTSLKCAPTVYFDRSVRVSGAQINVGGRFVKFLTATNFDFDKLTADKVSLSNSFSDFLNLKSDFTLFWLFLYTCKHFFAEEGGLDMQRSFVGGGWYTGIGRSSSI